MSEEKEISLDTSEKLLEAAGEIFAEKGFRAATVREIVDQASVNLNAVNYHFRDKKGLYTAVVQYAERYAKESWHSWSEKMQEVSAEQQLYEFIHTTLSRLFSEGRKSWQLKLLARELAEPTEALDIVVEYLFKPRFERLISIIHEMVGEQMSDRNVQLCAKSIIGQCLHFVYSRQIVMRLMTDLTYSQSDIELFAKHIHGFSYAAIKCMSQKQDLS